MNKEEEKDKKLKRIIGAVKVRMRTSQRKESAPFDHSLVYRNLLNRFSGGNDQVISP